MNTKRIWIVGILVVVVIVLGVMYWPRESRAPEAPQGPAVASGTPAGGAPATSSASSTSPGGATVTTTLGWKYYRSDAYGISVNYPQDWLIGSVNPIILDNFNNKYTADGIIPLGGAEVDIVGTTLHGSLDNIINTEVPAATVASTSTLNAAGVTCRELFYGAHFSGGQTSKNIAVYCPGKTLLKIFLSYRAEDPKGASFVATFKQILGTIDFVQ